MTAANVHKYIQISLYTLQIRTCFSQPCNHFQECKVQRLCTLKV